MRDKKEKQLHGGYASEAHRVAAAIVGSGDLDVGAGIINKQRELAAKRARPVVQIGVKITGSAGQDCDGARFGDGLFEATFQPHEVAGSPAGVANALRDLAKYIGGSTTDFSGGAVVLVLVLSRSGR